MKIVIKDGRAYDFNPLGRHFVSCVVKVLSNPGDHVIGFYVKCETGGNMNRGYAKIWKPSDVKVL